MQQRAALPEEPRRDENENAGQRSKARWRVIHLDVEEIFLDLNHLIARGIGRTNTLENEARFAASFRAQEWRVGARPE